ncbi:MAG: hypothetical protein JHC33_02775 [Ignisphaera sp.]|nr:hypothetical protein [Ignisphaera sp.]
MIYVIQEEYGHYYESAWNNIIGYTDNQLEANVLKEKLETQYDLSQKYKDIISNEEDNLYDMLPDNYSIEEYEKLYEDPMRDFKEALGINDTSAYDYDYYNVRVCIVNKV